MPRDLKVIRSGDLGIGRSKPAGASGGGYGHGKKRYETIFQKTTPAVEGDFAPFPASVSREVNNLLMLGGKRTPYSHQALAAFHFLDEGRNVVLVTPTASGKTVSFLAPVLTLLQRDVKANAVMLYPMNALAVDQLKNLIDLGFVADTENKGLYRITLGGREIVAGVLNGDTTEATRRDIRQSASLLITNHVALHASVLAQSTREYSDGSSWGRFLSGVQVVVLDEVHSYNGVEGTHAALAFRRLFLLVECHSRKTPRVILATATIGNPEEHAKGVTGMSNWALVNKSGARSFVRDFEVVLPNEHPGGDGRWAASTVVLDLVKDEAAQGRRVLIFCQSRNGTERMADRLNDGKAKHAIPFHAGIPAAQKTEFIQRILRGEAREVCTTSALELGVDIGGMDTVVMLGHPGDNAAFNQRSGRVGRTGNGRVILVLDETQNSLNTYLQLVPEAIFWDPENRTVFPGNLIIATRHAACAYIECNRDEAMVRRWFPKVNMEEVKAAADDEPHAKIAMIGLGNFGKFKAESPSGQTIQVLGGQDALTNWHKGAIIRSPMGEFFRVVKLDLNAMIAVTEDAELRKGQRLYTSPTVTTYKDMLTPDAFPPVVALRNVVNCRSGIFDVKRQTVSFKIFSDSGREVSDDFVNALEGEDRNPAIGILTRGLEFSLSSDHPLHGCVFQVMGASSVMREALALVLPLLIQARGSDVPIEITSTPEHLNVFIYDLAEGGMGWADALAGKMAKWLNLAGNALLKCRCRMAGCPRCSMSSLVGAERRALAMAMAKAL